MPTTPPSDPGGGPDPADVVPAEPGPGRGRRALWGIGAVATSPDVWDGPARRRLVRAATVTSVMGLAWASTTTPAIPSRHHHREDAEVSDAATPGDDVTALASPFERWQPSEPPEPPAAPVRPATDGGATAAPSPGADRAPARDRPAATPEARDDARARQRDPQGKREGREPREKRDERERRQRQESRRQRQARAREQRRQDAEAARRREARQERRAQQRQERRQRERAAAEAAANAWRGHPLASHEQVVIVQPSPDVRMVGFHEAAIPGARSLGLTAAPDAHHGRDWVPHVDTPDELRTMVLPSRGRRTHSSSAMDVAIPAGRTVHAPVTGVVTTVEPYLLYGRYPDTRIVIRPDARPDLRLVVLHVTGHAVAVGDHVEAGVTPIAASSTPFPFESQIDRFTQGATGTATPHVHLELRPG